MRVLGVCWGIKSAALSSSGVSSECFPLLIIIVVNHHLKPNHRSIRKPNNLNQQAAFDIGDQSFHTGDTDR
jgi:hypothetical protein